MRVRTSPWVSGWLASHLEDGDNDMKVKTRYSCLDFLKPTTGRSFCSHFLPIA